MFGVGASELVIIVVLALLVVGPKRLPAVLRKMGRAIGDLRRGVTDLRKEVGYDEVLDDVTRPLREGMEGLDKQSLLALEAEVLAAQHDEEELVRFMNEYPFDAPDTYGALAEEAVSYPDEKALIAKKIAAANIAPKSSMIEVRQAQGAVSREDNADPHDDTGSESAAQ